MGWDIVLKNKITIQRILSVILISFSLAITVIIAIFLNIGINSSFDKYLVSKNQQIIKSEQENLTNSNYQKQGQFSNTPNRNMQLNSVEIDLKKSINNYIIIIGISSFIVSILAAYLLSKRLTKPLLKIEDATNKIKNGNYNLQIDNDTKIKEIFNLVLALDSMAKKISDNIEHDKRITQDIQHELRTPLTNLKAQVEAMLDGIWEIDEKNLQLCLSEINRLNSIVQQLYQLGMIEDGDSISFSEIRLKEFVDSIIRENIFSLEEKEMEVINNINPNIAIYSDENLLKSAVFNLITNSIRYSGNKSIIQINLDQTNKNNKDYYIIDVIDNGVGIPEDKLNQIFDRFYRVDKSRSRQNGGAGLGLSIVSAVANKLGGFVLVESKEKVMTKFSIYIEKRLSNII